MTRALRDYQREGNEAIRAEHAAGRRRTAAVLATGLGKGSPVDTWIPSPDGMRRLGNLEVGDRIYGVDGLPVTVIGTFDRGTLPAYRVTFTDETSAVVDGDHRWEVRARGRKSTVLTTAELAAGPLRDGAAWRWAIPMTDPVQRPSAALAIPPYTLGALIANGYLHGRGAPTLTTPDHDVIALVKAEHVEVVERPVAEHCCPRWTLPRLQVPIRALGLDVPAAQKFIPARYLAGDVDQRIALLRGLMDADGSSRSGGRRSVSYHTTSRRLAGHVQELVWSLGGTARIKTYDRTDEGKPVEYAVRILTPTWLDPFGTDRKRQADQPRRAFGPRRAIVSIEPVGEMSIRCISVDGPRELYLTGREYIVTHNTDMIAELAWSEVDDGGRVLCLCHRYELLDQITARLRMYRPGYGIGRIGAGRKVIGMPVDVGMTPTLASGRGTVLARLPQYSMVIYDECHHAPARGNVKVLERLGCMPGGATRLAGFTATMYRAERRGWGTASTFDSIAFERGIHWGIEHGHLVRPYGVAVKADHVKLDKVKSNAAGDDYADGALGEMVMLDVEQVVDAVLRRERADPRQTAMFWPTVEAAALYAEAFTAAGYPTRLVTGKTKVGDGPDDRGSAEKGTGIYGALASGKIWATSGVMVQTEGWDCPPVSRIVMGRPTKRPGLYQQIAGRMLRTCDPIQYPGFPPKVDAEMLDIVGMVRGQTLATLADLVPGVQYDDQAIEAIPCEQCGGFTARALRVDPTLGERCVCRAGNAPERKGRAIKGPAEFEFVDLLGSEWLWLQTPQHELPVLAVGVRFAVIRDNGDGTFRAAHLALRGPRSRDWIRRDAQVLTERASIERARMACEDWAGRYERESAGASWQAEYGRSASSWRKRGGRPSQGQLDTAYRLGIEGAAGMNKRDLSDAITLAMIGARGFR